MFLSWKETERRRGQNAGKVFCIICLNSSLRSGPLFWKRWCSLSSHPLELSFSTIFQMRAESKIAFRQAGFHQCNWFWSFVNSGNSKWASPNHWRTQSAYGEPFSKVILKQLDCKFFSPGSFCLYQSYQPSPWRLGQNFTGIYKEHALLNRC